MCRSCSPVRKFVAYEPQADEEIKQAEEEEAKKEKELAAAILAALLLLKPWAKTYMLIAAMPWKDFEAALSSALAPGFAIHDLAGASVVSGIGTFDPLGSSSINRQALYREQFLREFGGETRKAMELSYAWIIKRGLDQSSLVKIMRAIAGLNSRQAGAVLSQWASRKDAGATEKALDRMLEAAAKKYLKERAKTTAQSEGWRLWNLGQYSAMEQQEARGAVIRKFWVVTPDERLCDSCAPIPGMNDKGVAFGAPFQTPIGPTMIPPLHPRCRCSPSYVVNWSSF